jgi:hypothetical protein
MTVCERSGLEVEVVDEVPEPEVADPAGVADDFPDDAGEWTASGLGSRREKGRKK